jgi:hypothetical protein
LTQAISAKPTSVSPTVVPVPDPQESLIESESDRSLFRSKRPPAATTQVPPLANKRLPASVSKIDQTAGDASESPDLECSAGAITKKRKSKPRMHTLDARIIRR